MQIVSKKVIKLNKENQDYYFFFDFHFNQLKTDGCTMQKKGVFITKCQSDQKFNVRLNFRYWLLN